MDIALIKQGVTSYGHIEAGIERAARGMPELRLLAFDLSPHYFSQRPPLSQQKHPVRMRHAIEGLLRQLLADRTPVALLLNGFVLEKHHPGFFAALRGAGKRIAGWQIDDPYYIDMAKGFAQHLDVVPTVDSSTVGVYQAMGKKAAFLPLACDPGLHRAYPGLEAKYRSDVCFVGTPFAGSRRTRMIDELWQTLPRYDTKIVGATERDSWKKSLAHFAELERCIRDERVSPVDAARYFSGARINLNIHKDSYGHAWDRNEGHVEARSPAERTYAVAGCAGFQLIDATRPDLASQFEPGKELVTFADAADLAAKIDYYLAHEEERSAIARAAQKRAYGEHTYRHRLQAIVSML